MTSQIPFTPLTAAALGRLTPEECQAFSSVLESLGMDMMPTIGEVVELACTVHRLISASLEELAATDGAHVSTDWCVAWGGQDANDCAGRLGYDDQAEAEEMTQWIDGGIVAKQTVIRLPWATVPQEQAPGDER